MKLDKSEGTGLLELIIAIPIILMILAGLMSVFRALEVKSEALHESLAYTLITERKNEPTEIRPPRSFQKKTSRLDYRKKKNSKNPIFKLLGIVGTFETETVIDYTPKNIGLGIFESENKRNMREKAMVVCDPWDESSPTAKKLKAAVLIPPLKTFSECLLKIR